MNLDAALDEAMAAPTPKRGPDCSMGLVLQVMPDETRDRVLRALTTQRQDGSLVPSTVIADLLIAAGYNVKVDAVQRHRRRVMGRTNGCACRVTE
jgi:hypothetical protein